MSAEQSSFVIADAAQCSGCRACELACFAGHQTAKAKTAGAVTGPVIPRLYLVRGGGGACMPVQCHHCEDAPCMQSCLTGAIERKDGAVIIDERRCIGCRNCALACPFGAIEVFPLSSIRQENKDTPPRLVYKCDLCAGEKEPACAAACPNNALRLVNPAEDVQVKRINAISAFDTPPQTPRTS
jgi:electron transport protein HydN